MIRPAPQGFPTETTTSEQRAPAKRRVFVGAAVIALALLTYFQFPGHTFLQSDSQIYMPILEHFRDPSVFRHEMLAQHPHVSFTIYDEVALGLQRLTGLEFLTVLSIQQVIYRALGILGVFLLGTALGLSDKLALLASAAFSLGATIAGPTVLTFEYEPVPRGYSVPLIFLALGLVAHGRDLGAGVAATLAFLYHAPAAFVFWAVYFALALWPSQPAVMKRRIWGLAPLACGAFIMLLLSRWQIGPHEPQMFFTQIDPALEKLQRMRAPYNWIGIWVSQWIWHFLFLFAVALGAFWRLRRRASEDLRFFLIGMPLLGMLSLPVSYVLLDVMKWGLIPQVQPGRALLFVTALAGILAAIAGLQAGQQGRYWETLLWLLPVFAIPTHTRVLEVLIPNLSNATIRRRALLVLALALCGALAAWALNRKRRWAVLVWAAAVLLPYFAIPGYGRVTNYPNLHTPELEELSAWARTRTPKDAVFVFPDARRDLYPGIFRAKSLRSVYVDWKTGGQINYLKAFADEWWPRWQQTMQDKFRPAKIPIFASLGIDYIVLRAPNRLPGKTPVFENSQFVAYAIR